MIDDMGFPAGLPRTIVVDLTGKLPAGTRKIRISTNLQIYWDQILLDNGRTERSSEPRNFHSRDHRLPSADTPSRSMARLPATYLQLREGEHDRAFSRQRGTYTRYGDLLSC